MAAARWQKCVYVHKSRIFADIPHPLCVCAPDFMNISFELEREIVVQWKGLSYLNIFTARHHHSIPSLPLSGLLVHCRIRTTGVCVCVMFWLGREKRIMYASKQWAQRTCAKRAFTFHTHTHLVGTSFLVDDILPNSKFMQLFSFGNERYASVCQLLVGCHRWFKLYYAHTSCVSDFHFWSLSFFSICNEDRATRSLSLSFVHLSNFGVSFCSPAAWMHTENCISPEFIDFLIKLCHFSP